MKLTAAIVLAGLLLAGCNSLQAVESEFEVQTLAAAEHSTNVVHWNDEGAGFPVVPGSRSTLVRNRAGLSMTVHTSGLEPGHAYTVWWVIFNDPAACFGGECGEDDVLPPGINPEAGVGVLHAAGHVLGGNGKANFGGHLQVGNDSGLLMGVPLSNPLGAEVHLVVRTHGPAVPGIIPEQIHSFGGGCSEATGGAPGAEGFDCFDPQFAVHQPQ